MADVYKGLTIKLGVDDTALSKALRKAKSDASGVTTELRRLEKALKLDPGNTKLLSAQQEGYRKQIRSTEEQLKLLKQAESEIGETEMTSDQWTRLQADIAMCEQKLKGYKQALAESVVQQSVADSALGKMGSKLQDVGERWDVIGRKMQSVGSGLTRTVTAGIVAAGAASVAAAVQIDTSLTNVRKTVDGTEEQYQKLKEAAIEFSETNAVSASQILDIQALGAQLGFAIDELDEFGQVVSGLDIATNMDADQAATEMAQFANITKMSHGEISNYGSAIVGLGNNFATTESAISSMAMRIAASGTQVGMSQADILGLATALSSMGVEAEAGGTAISTIMAQIDKDIALAGAAMAGTSDMTQKEIDKVNVSLETWASTAGMSAQEFSDAWRNDPVQALSALLSNMEAATAEGGNMSVMLDELGISSIRQTDVMKRLAGNSEFVADAVGTANEAWAENTALQKEVDNRNDSLAAKFEILKNRVIAIAEQFGGPLADALLDALDAAEPLFEAISDGAQAFSEMDEDQQKLILTLIAVVAAMGPFLSITGKVGGVVKGVGNAMEQMARFLAKVDVATMGASRSAKVYGTEAKASAAATKGMSTSTKAASVAMGGLKAAIASTGFGILLVIVGEVAGKIMEFADAARQAEERDRAIEAANGALKSSLDGLQTGFDAAKSSAGDYGVTADDVKAKADDLAQAHQDLADSLTDTMTEAGSNAGMLESYMGIIEELGTKSDLTQSEQARLRDAVGQVNSACGTSFAVTDDVNGALWGQVDAIKAVVSAQQDRLRYEAASEGLKQVYQQQEEDLLEITRLEQQRNDLMEKHKGQTAAQWGEDAQVYTETINALGEARDQYNATSETAKLYEERVGELGAALGSSASEISEFASASSAVSGALAESGQSVDDFAAALEQCGASTSELSSLTDEQLAALAASYDGSVQSIVAKLQEFGLAAAGEGANAASGFASGLSEGTEQAVAAAAEVTGSSIDQIKADCEYFGIEGDAAVLAYATALANGSSQAQAAAAAAAASGAAGASKPQEFIDSAAQSMDAYKQRLADRDGANRAAAQAAASGARGAGSQGSAFGSSGQAMLSRFNAAVSKSAGSREAGAQPARAAASGMQSQNDNAATWGSHLVRNFASGIRGMVDAARGAATTVANAVAGIIGHSIPKEGPLRNRGKGEKEWGEHTVENYASGVRAKLPILKKAMGEVSGTVAGALSSTEAVRMSASAQSSFSSDGVNVTVQAPDGLTKADVCEAVAAAMENALSNQGDVVLRIDDREFGRAVRRSL